MNRLANGWVFVNTSAPQNKKNRLAVPLMHAFRAAHEARDGKQKLDLRDSDGVRVIAGRRANVRAAVTEHMLRREVAQDLEMLMNTINLDSCEDLSEFEHARRSVLNFGLPDIVHRSLDEASTDDIRDEIRQALADYEPRLVKETIDVRRDTGLDPTQLQLRFVVHADLMCVPVNTPVEFIADVDVSTGKVQVSRL